MENYFNYFTEAEECFRKCRGTPTLLSTLDWALLESWKEAGIPIKAVLAGIERAFEKFQKRPQPFRKINGLAYCSQAVFEAAEELKTALVEGGPRPQAERIRPPSFGEEEVRGYLNRNAEVLEQAGGYWRQDGQPALTEDFGEAAEALRRMAGSRPEAIANLQDLENLLSALEEKLLASVTRASSVELLAQIQGEVERGLVSCRDKMTAAQIDTLGRQYRKRCLFERYGVPRLSLFFCL